jgi:hypothetical protein
LDAAIHSSVLDWLWGALWAVKPIMLRM